MPANIQTPKVGSLIEIGTFHEPPRPGSIFIVSKKGKSKKCVWVKLIGVRTASVGKAWQVDGLPDAPIQFEFRASYEQSLDRLPGRYDYVKAMTIILDPKDKWSASAFENFDKAHLADMKREFEQMAAMNADEEGPAISPSPQAVFTGYLVIHKVCVLCVGGGFGVMFPVLLGGFCFCVPFLSGGWVVVVVVFASCCWLLLAFRVRFCFPRRFGRFVMRVPLCEFLFF